ncbi:MAG: TRAP transporter large permease subunit, partial [Burkholderiales bacterium]|nr:TRAP transporter large permease subunit [Burkholderiales bacterium]
MEFLVDNLAPIMFFNLIVFLLLGFPVAFSLAATGVLYGLVAIDLNLMSPLLFQALPQRVFGIVGNDTLLAVPFFTFMGLILERSGMAEDLLDTVGQLFGPLRGGLAIAVVFVGALLAATTGVVSASVISMGLISLPIMLRYGYDRRLASGVIAASGTLSQIIPPSLVLIILADQLGRSIGDMYRGAMLPGLLLAGAYMAYIFLVAIVRPGHVPALPPEARGFVDARGRRGLRSLAFLTLIAAAAAYWGSDYYFRAHTDVPVDERVVIVLLIWGAAALA